jgi:hypothetical protein
MPVFGSTAGGATPVVPKFGSTGGASSYVKPAALVGCLVIIEPKYIDKVEGYQFKEGDPLKDQMTADAISLDGPVTGEFPGMWWSQSNLIREAKRILNITTQTEARVSPKGEKSERYIPDGEPLDEVLAGRLWRKPKKEYKDEFPTKESLEEAIRANPKMVPTKAYSWVLEAMGPKDTELATAYYATGRTLPDEDPDADPFGDD